MLLLILTTFLGAIFSVTAHSSSSSSPQRGSRWTGWGGNLHNNRWAADNKNISSANIQSLLSSCTIAYPIGVSATPVLAGNIAYYPTWNGSFAALDFVSCRLLWQVNVTGLIESFAPITTFQMQQMKKVSRSSPQVDVDNNVIYMGTLTHALVIALDRLTGKTLDVIQVNSHALATLTMSPTLFEGKLFVGASSLEENVSLLPDYPCCNFVGNMVSLVLERSRAGGKAFKVLWNVTTIPASRRSAGWSGAGLWGSQPSIDKSRRQLYVATGNAYSIPNATIRCQKATQNNTSAYMAVGSVRDPCLPEDIWQDSVLAIDIDKGTVNWAHQPPKLDAYSAACGYPGIFAQNTTLCPEIPGEDADFGMAPAFVPYARGDMVVLGRKNGDIYALSARTGHSLWQTSTSPVGIGGGLSWGIAVDDSRVYYTAINSGENAWQLRLSNRTVSRSAYGALSLENGAVLWETEAPSNNIAFGPPSIVGDLVLVARTGQDPDGAGLYDQSTGGLVALEKSTGRIIMDHGLDTNFHGGVAVQDRYVLFGTGYLAYQPPALVPGGFHVMLVSG
ncbi:Quino protein alcohol dehydrogenase-like protein [Thozetella sp. PMI_491]|nr:Quino protein alcohol dehydrogenase-like protein [Thozetella sp. PMI_491]